MNKILDWIKNLEPEMILLLSLSLIILVVLIIVLTQANKIFSAIAKKTLVVKEDLLLDDKQYTTRISVTNIGYVNNVVKEIGFIYKDIKMPLVVDTINLGARESYMTSIKIEELRAFIVGDNNKVKEFYIYTIDALNRVTNKKMKLSYNYIHNEILLENKEIKALKKAENKAEKAARKAERFESGNYNIGDRLLLFLKALGSPFVKFSKWCTRKINSSIRKSELKKEVKLKLKAEQEEANKEEVLQKEAELRAKYHEIYSDKLAKEQAKKDKQKEVQIEKQIQKEVNKAAEVKDKKSNIELNKKSKTENIEDTTDDISVKDDKTKDAKNKKITEESPEVLLKEDKITIEKIKDDNEFKEDLIDEVELDASLETDNTLDDSNKDKSIK